MVMKKNFVIMCFVSLLPLLANAQFETINDVRYYYSKSKSAYEVVKIPSNQSPDFSGYSGDITVLNYINGKKVTTIDKRAFYWSDITSIKLPLSLTTIGEEAFAGNREITSIEIPQNVEYIHKEAFRYCENLKDIYCYAKCPILGKDVFGKVKGFTLHVPEDYISYYKNADQWKKAKKIVATTSPSSAFEREKMEMAEIQAKNAELNKKIADEFKMAEEGNVDAMIGLAQRYLNGEGVDKDNKKAFQLYKKAAEHGNADAQYYIASCYYYGNNVDKNVDTALSWIIKSANQGNIKAKKLQEEYNKQYGSYYNNSNDWRIVNPEYTMMGIGKHIKIYFKGENYHIILYDNGGSKGEELINGKKDKLYIYGSNWENSNNIGIFGAESLPLQDIYKIIKEKLLPLVYVDNDKYLSVYNGSIENYIGSVSKSGFKTKAQMDQMDKEEKQSKRQALNKKYGKTFVDAIYNCRLLVGMPIKLLINDASWVNVYKMHMYNGGEYGDFKVEIMVEGKTTNGWTSGSGVYYRTYRVWVKNWKITQFRNWNKADEREFNRL